MAQLFLVRSYESAENYRCRCRVVFGGNSASDNLLARATTRRMATGLVAVSDLGDGWHLFGWAGLAWRWRSFRRARSPFASRNSTRVCYCRSLLRRCRVLHCVFCRALGGETVCNQSTPDLTNRWSQPLAALMSHFDFMKQFLMFAALAAASGRSACSR